jgi:hypothetical protein
MSRAARASASPLGAWGRATTRNPPSRAGTGPGSGAKSVTRAPRRRKAARIACTWAEAPLDPKAGMPGSVVT